MVTNSFKSHFSAIILGDFSGLSSFHYIKQNDIIFFIVGRLYNITPEVLLQNYIKQGIQAFKVVDGDFLIMIYENKKIHFVRDRHGVGKQLFYSNNYFTTDLLDFTLLEGFDCNPNIEVLLTFLSIGYIPSPLTSLEGVKKLNPGFILTIENNTLSTQDLFDFKDFMNNVGTTSLSIEEATIEYERLHKKAIKDRIENSTKVGLLLSGGYDSAGNISALRDVYDGKIVTYSIGFKDNPWTELPLAKILSDKYKSNHYEYEIDGSEIINLPQIIKTTGDPFQEGGLMVNFTAMQMVKDSNENPEIILGGDGNDQHFGTSGKELAMHWKLKSNGIQLMQKIYDKLGDNYSAFEKDNILFRTQFHNRKILHIQQSDVFGFTKQQVNRMNLVGNNLKQFSYLEKNKTKYSNFDDFFYNRNYNIDIKQVINEVILFKSSRMAEAFSNNISFPYMSTDLYDFLKTMPRDYKFRGSLEDLSKGKGVSKYLHKNYLKQKLPTEITDRKKQGGFAPLPIFLKNDKQRKIIFDILRNSDAIKKILDIKKIEKLLEQYDFIVNSNSYWFWFQQVKANQIINLLTLVVWWEMYINKKSSIKTIHDLI